MSEHDPAKIGMQLGREFVTEAEKFFRTRLVDALRGFDGDRAEQEEVIDHFVRDTEALQDRLVRIIEDCFDHVPAGDIGRGPGVEVYAHEYGRTWPLTVDHGTLRCDGEDKAVTFEAPDGTVYALNGPAKVRSLGIDIDPIQLRDPDNPRRGGVGPLINRGLDLCEG